MQILIAAAVVAAALFLSAATPAPADVNQGGPGIVIVNDVNQGGPG